MAILDTGFDADHEAFSVMPTDGKYTKSDIANLLKGKLSCGVSNVDDVYINEKAPFGYDYAGGDPNAEAVASPTASTWPVRLPVTTATTSRAWLPMHSS